MVVFNTHKAQSVTYMWNYFEIGHGKGEHDGARESFKISLRRE